MVKKYLSDKKLAFSLVEALIVMTIAAIFVAVMASVVPHKSKPKISADAHGGFECYWKNNKLYSRTITVGNENTEKEETGNYCVFKPGQYISYIIINAVGGGARGGTNNGGSAGRFASAFFPIPNTSYKLYPGKGGTNSHHDGYQSKVTTEEDTIITVSGGNDAIVAQEAQVSDIIDVYATKGMNSTVVAYGCNYTPRAWLGTDKYIYVSYCATSANIVEKKLEFSNPAYTKNANKYKTILNSPVVNDENAKVLSRLKPGTIDTWEYYDIDLFLEAGYSPLNLPNGCTYSKITNMNDPMCPSRYKIEIKLNIPDNGDDGAVSSLTKYANLMHYTNLESLKPGNGGPKGNGKGRPGAILISW